MASAASLRSPSRDHGRVIWDGGLDELVERHGEERTLVVDLADSRPPLELTGERVVRVDGSRQWLRFSRAETTAAELVVAVAGEAQLADLSVEEPEIEEIVRRIYREGV